jgi:hypothetical protein
LYSSDGLALEVRRIDYYQVAAVPDRVVNIGQIPAGQFGRLRMARSEYSLTRSTGLGGRTSDMRFKDALTYLERLSTTLRPKPDEVVDVFGAK